MGEDSSNDCRSWEEQIYWTHFQCIHFTQFLPAGFEQRLAIPKKFTTNLKKKLPDSVTLKGPSGVAWKVGITITNDTWFFSHGWEEFVKDHLLEVNDLLIFKYNGVSHFDILMFDKQSMCEKAASYFVRKCRQGEHENGCQTEKKTSKRSCDATDTPLVTVVCSQPENSDANATDTIPLGIPIISKVANKRNQRKAKLIKPSLTRKKVRIEEPSSDEEIEPGVPTISQAMNEVPGEEAILIKPVCARKTVRNEKASSDEKIEGETDNPKFEWVAEKEVVSINETSSRRLVTEEEKENAVQLAQAAVSDEGFIVVMKPTHVYRRFFMAIPSAWISKTLAPENQDVILRVNESTWKTRFYYHKARNSGGLNPGLKNFVADNNLHEFDVCVFEPGGMEYDKVVLDVKIFRAVEEAVPLAIAPPLSVS